MTTVSKAQLLSNTHDLHEVAPFPYTNTGFGMAWKARYTVNATHTNADERTPGPIKLYRLINEALPDINSNRQYANGLEVWGELSSEDRVRVDADVAFLRTFLYTLSSSGVWTLRHESGVGGDGVGHGFLWQSEPGGNMSHGTYAGVDTYGWNSVSLSGNGVRFGDALADPPHPNPGFVRIHWWAEDWTNTPNGFFFLSQNPTVDDGAANRALCDSIIGLAWGIEVVAVGPDAAAAKFVLQSGIDYLYEGVPTSGLVPGQREGTGGQLIQVTTSPRVATGHTLSDAMLDLYPPPFMTPIAPAPAPSITAIAPASGSELGGTTVVITGTAFTGATDVDFDGIAAAAFTVNSSTQITATTPANTGTGFVTVTTPDGTSSTSAASLFTWALPLPFVTTTATFTNVSGTPITTLVAGERWYLEVETVSTGWAELPPYEYGAIISAWTAGLGAIDTIEAYIDSAWVDAGPIDPITVAPLPLSLIGEYALDHPTPYSLEAVTLSRLSGIATTAGLKTASIKEVNGTAVSNVATDTITITAAPPPPADPPSITSATPNTGTTLGGDVVELVGTDFTGATAVTFDATAATSFTVNSSTSITAISPAHAAGAISITVTTPTGSDTIGFTYTVVAPPPDPVITSLTPDTGVESDIIVIAGTDLTNVTDVLFGSTSVVGFSVDSAIQITTVAPGGLYGDQYVTVIDPSGASNALIFTFPLAPEPILDSRFVTCPAGATPALKFTQLLTDVNTSEGGTDSDDMLAYLTSLTTVTHLNLGEDWFWYGIVEVQGDTLGEDDGLGFGVVYDSELGNSTTIGQLFTGEVIAYNVSPNLTLYFFLLFGINPTDYNPAASITVTFDTTSHGTFTPTATVEIGDAPVDTNDPPVAHLIVTPNLGPATLSVTADGSTSTDPDGTIVSYAWDWGDGTPTSSGVTATHDYTAPGTYTVTLTVTDNDGATDTETAVVVVTNPPEQPVACFTAIPDTGPPVLTVAVDASCSTDADGDIVSYTWDFGDLYSLPADNVDTGITSTHDYRLPGTYVITLTVADSTGLVNIATHTITVTHDTRVIHALASDPMYVVVTS